MTNNDEKQRVTAAMTICASGRKLDSVFIQRGKTTRCLKSIKPTPRTLWLFQKSAWMDGSLVKRVLKEVIAPHTKGRPSALIMDDFGAHWVAGVKAVAAELNIHLIMVPPGQTPKRQPLDFGVYGPVKSVARGTWRRALSLDPEQKLTLNDAVSHYRTAYRHVTRDAIVKAFNGALERSCSHLPASLSWTPPTAPPAPPPVATPVPIFSPSILGGTPLFVLLADFFFCGAAMLMCGGGGVVLHRA